jgi:diguanylate cyclase (GGDEF)-like protein/PAS domain S-box-containing protein
MQPYRLFAVLGVLVAAVYLAGWFDAIERQLLDLRTGLSERSASDELLIVAIDTVSLRALGGWPWPRRHHADAVERLVGAGAARIAYDVDLSAPTEASEDQILAEAFALAGPDRIGLPIFQRLRQTADHGIERFEQAPLPLFGDHASATSIELRPDADGLVRRLGGAAPAGDVTVPSMPAWLLGDPGAAEAALAVSAAQVAIDYGIDPATIPRLSFIDLLGGRFDRTAIAGRRVVVGPTAIELGDWISVPRHWALPRSVVQALAFETLIQNRNLVHVSGWLAALGALLATLLAGPVFARLSWRLALALLAGSLVLVSGLAVVLQAWAAIALDTTGLLCGLVLAFIAAMSLRIEPRVRPMVGQTGALPVAESVSRELVNSSFDAILTFDAGGTVLSCNGAAERLFGRSADDIVGHPLTRLLPDEHHRALTAFAQDGGSRELLAACGDGRRIPVEAALSRMQVDARWIGIAMLHDITQRKVEQAELERLALHDALTGLPNRTLLNDRIDHAISAAKRSGEAMAVLLLDLDRFKEVNDTLGHQVGDLLLTEVGPRLRQPLRDTDTVARLGGDEFAILLPGPTDVPAACRIAERIVEAFRRPFAIDELSLEVGISIGVALYPDHGEAAEQLLQHADAAMYTAKRNGFGFVVYNAESETNSVRRLTLTGELRRAIENDQLSLSFQPKVDVHGGLAGVEALVRWQHPEEGLIAPEQFVPSAERTGLIRPLTLWVVNAVLRQQHAWRAAGFEINAAVNLSVKSLHDPELASILELLFQRWQTDASCLTLELTESALMADPETSMTVLRPIERLGCKLSLDDFGTGYSSLPYLQRLPISEIKIDRSFVVAMTRDENAAVIVRSIVKLAKSLGLTVVAEGVESEDAFSWLRALGCDQVQGYYLGRAMSGEELLTWLKESPWSQDLQQDRMQPA